MTNQDSLPTSQSGLLATLRDLGREPAGSMARMRRVAVAQASILRQAVSGSLHEIPARVAIIVPTVIVEYVAHLPVAGISYWANRRWHLHIRKEDPAEVQAFTVLWQLKRIIDHPLRQQQDGFSESEWDGLADYFACRVLDQISTIKGKERRNAYE